MKLCKAEGCQKPVRTRGMCAAHYTLWWRFGDLVSRTASNGAGADFIARATQYRGVDCYLWPYGKKDGYGSIQLNGHSQRVHRIVCESVYGDPPFAKAEAAHTCGVRACCNPAHLRWDTRQGNMDDTLTHGTRRLGERVTGAKLTAEAVMEIRGSSLSVSQLEKQYGVSRGCIVAIKKRLTWRHIP